MSAESSSKSGSSNESRPRRRRTSTAMVASLAAVIVPSVAACNDEAPTEAIQTSTITVYETPSSTSPTTESTTATTTKPATTEETTTTTSAAEAPVAPLETLCSKAAELGVTKVLGKASCKAVTKDVGGYFDNVIEGARWVSGRGIVAAEIISDPGFSRSGNLPAYGGHNVQQDERDKYGLGGFNTICNPDMCLAQAGNLVRYGGDVDFVVAGNLDQGQNLRILSNLVREK